MGWPRVAGLKMFWGGEEGYPCVYGESLGGQGQVCISRSSCSPCVWDTFSFRWLASTLMHCKLTRRGVEWSRAMVI